MRRLGGKGRLTSEGRGASLDQLVRVSARNGVLVNNSDMILPFGCCTLAFSSHSRGAYLPFQHNLKRREGAPEMGTKPLKGLRGYRASNRGSKNL